MNMLAIEASIVKRAVFFGQPSVSDFLISELNLNSMKGVFDLASNRTQQLFVGNSLCRELLSLTVTFRGRISYFVQDLHYRAFPYRDIRNHRLLPSVIGAA